jgi:hypothetical protein
MQRVQVARRHGRQVDPIQIDAPAALNQGLAIQRQMVGIFRHQNRATVASVGRPPSISRAGTGACTTPSSQVRQDIWAAG